jgi:hypothetical protein
MDNIFPLKMLKLLIFLGIILLLLLLFYLSTIKKVETPKEIPIAFIYSTVDGWTFGDIKCKEFIDNEKLPDGVRIISVDVGSFDNVVLEMQKMYNIGVRHFIGMSGGEIIEKADPFIAKHPDAFILSCGNTLTELQHGRKNVFRLALSDLENLMALDKVYKLKTPLVLYEKGELWAKSMAHDTLKLWPESKLVEYDPKKLIIEQLPKYDGDVMILTAIYNENVSKIADNYPKSRLFLGDGSYGFEIDSHREFNLPIYYGYDSSILEKYKIPYVPNIYDSILAIKYSLEHDIPIKDISTVGINGIIHFTENNMRKYGRIALARFKNRTWSYTHIYSDDSLGKCVAEIKPSYFDISPPDTSMIPQIKGNKVAVILSTKLDELSDKTCLELLENEKLPKNLEIKVINLDSLSDLEEKLEDLYQDGFRYFIGFTTSTMLVKSNIFFRNHPDTICFSSGSTITKIENRSENIFRMNVTNDILVEGIKYNNIEDLVALYQKDDIWSKDMADVLNVNNLAYDDTNPDLEEINQFVGDGKRVAIFTVSNLNLKEIISSLPTNTTVYLGDGSYPFQIGNHDKEIYATLYYPFDSSILSRYKIPSAINMLDILGIIEHSIRNNKKIGTFLYIGYTGDTSFNLNKDRLFYRISTSKYTTMWNSYSIFGHESFGVYNGQVY